jgi:putative tricarboxylic transport membrane protein
MVLGNIMDVKLRSAMARVKTPYDFVDGRPIAMILVGIIVLVILLHLRTLWNEYKIEKSKHAAK